MLLIDVHKLNIILAEPIALRALEDQVDDIRRVLGLQCEDVFVLRASKHLLQRGQVDTESEVAIAAKGREGLGLEHHGYQGDVRVVHCLEGDAGVIAVEVAVLYEVLDRIDDLCQVSSWQKYLKDLTCLLEQIGLLQSCF